MSRDILTKRIEKGWASPNGRIRALRDTSHLEAKRNGAIYSGNFTRFTFWTVELLDHEGEIIDDESVDALDEAEDQAWWYQCRIDEGRDLPEKDEED